MTNVEKLLAEWERDEREGHPVGEQGIPIETAVRMLRAAIEADREGREGYEERWAVYADFGDGHYSCRESEDAARTSEEKSGFKAVKILVPTHGNPKEGR